MERSLQRRRGERAEAPRSTREALQQSAEASHNVSDPAPPKRTARIIQFARNDLGEIEQQRRRLLARVMTSQGRSAITRAAQEYRQAGFEFPAEQEVQLQLLELFDEELARQAICTLSDLLLKQPPIKKPIFEQRLRRLEEHADEVATRDAAAALRRVIRA